MNRKQRRAENKQRKAVMPGSSAGAPEVFATALRHHQAGRLNEAEPLYRQVLALDSRHADSLHLLGVIAYQTGRQDLAVDLIGKAIAISAGAAAYHSTLGLALRDLGRLDEAVACYRRAVDLKPDFPEAHNNLGNALKDQGRFEEAIAAYETAIRSGTSHCFSYIGLSGCRTFTPADRPLIADMQALLADATLSETGRCQLHFALGKIFDDLAEYETAIRHFDEANRLERGERRFNRSKLAAFVDWSLAAFPKEALKAPGASAAELPILIVGMPRSGTTLTEQILASHPKVAAGGELKFWLQRSDGIRGQRVSPFDPAAEQNAIRDYLGLLTGISSDAVRVTDKMPYNFLHLGLVHRLFPRARIIHCRRNPIDTALSIYLTRFAQINEFANNRNDIVLYYQEYRRLMEYWRALLPSEQLIEIDYEQLVADQESTSRRLVAFCGLDWDEACLDFHKTDRPIRTASAWQARQPIYRTSTERWRRYEPWLGELRELLP